MTGTDADLVALLLSADWFRAHWGSLGLVTDQRTEAEILRCARQIVVDMVGRRRRYEYVDFDRDRVDRTREAVFSLLEKHASGLPLDGAVRAVVAAGRNFAGPQAGAFEISYLNAGLVDEARDDIAAPLGIVLAEKVKTAISASRIVLDFHEDDTRSATSWDRCLCELGHDLPTFLSDFLFGKLLPECEVQAFRYVLSGKLDQQEITLMQCWYENEALELGMPFDVDWLAGTLAAA